MEFRNAFFRKLNHFKITSEKYLLKVLRYEQYNRLSMRIVSGMMGAANAHHGVYNKDAAFHVDVPVFEPL